ncbi:RNA methyltransferase, RsmE family [Opitutus sp. GAS368]|nr:RNA methyltransferase, RsmE family [Opitutus sp. GAS368]
MNIILFRSSEVELPLPRRDPRAQHILTVLRRRPGDTFDAGLVNGPRGKGTLVAVEEERLRITFSWGESPPPLNPLTLVIGLPRPQTARDILREATALGVAALHFIRTEKGEASYARSTLWTSGAWEECVISGAAQAFCTRLPEVSHGRTLAEVMATLPAGSARLALDNYESPAALSRTPAVAGQPVALALGAERGWSANERAQLRTGRFAFVHLGGRVLRTETACIAAVALLKAQRGWI